MSVCVCVKENAMSQYPCNISETSHNCQTYHSVICHVRVCVRVCEKNAMSCIRVTFLKLFTIVRHIILSCPCVCKRMPISATSLELLTNVSYIILSPVMSVSQSLFRPRCPQYEELYDKFFNTVYWRCCVC